MFDCLNFDWLNQDILFWTFSTIAQTFGALWALVGMVALYKIQILDKDLGNLISLIKHIFNFPAKTEFLKNYQLYRYIKAIHDNNKYKKYIGSSDSPSRYDFKKYFEIFDRIMMKSLPNLKLKIFIFSLLNIIIISLSLFGLIFNKILSDLSNIIMISIAISLSLFSLVFTYLIIKDCLIT
jgi:hypothetical protein